MQTYKNVPAEIELNIPITKSFPEETNQPIKTAPPFKNECTIVNFIAKFLDILAFL